MPGNVPQTKETKMSKLIVINRKRTPGKKNTITYNVLTTLFLAPFTIPFIALTIETFGGK